MRLSILVLLFSPLLYKVESETRSIHINCESEDPGFNLESADYRDTDLLVLDQCSLQDIEFWLRFLEKNYSNFIHLKSHEGQVISIFFAEGTLTF